MRKLARRSVQISLAALSSFCLSCSTPQQSEKKKEYTNTEKARMIVEIANGAIIEGDPTGALQHLARAEIEDPKLPELYHSRALAYHAKHEVEAAIQSVRAALALKPNYPDANNTLGKLLLDSGKYDEARVVLKLAASDPLYRDAYRAFTNLGILEYRLGRNQDAESYLNKAALEAPNQACIAYYYLGHIKLKNRQINEAVSDYRLATKKVCASFAEAQLALGLAYEQNQQYELARKTFVEIQKRYPNTKLAEQAFDQLKFLP